MQQLAEEERKEELERQQQIELEMKLRKRIEAQQAHRDQMAARMKKLQQEAREEAAYRQQVSVYEDSKQLAVPDKDLHLDLLDWLVSLGIVRKWHSILDYY